MFYEVDLPALLESDLEAFLYFYIFFRRAAYNAGPLSLDAILMASTEYARGVSDSLREQVSFGLDEAERALIERETKYAYGEW